MREILFRGKSKHGKWHFGFYTDGYYLDGTPVSWIEVVDQKKKKTDSPTVIPETVGQFTGLTDKNGKKVFEGDIIKSDNGTQSAVSVVCYGEFSPRMFYDLLEGFVMPRPKEKIVGLFLRSTKNGEEMFLSNGSKLIEVIGNIHDNPELLGGDWE